MPTIADFLASNASGKLQVPVPVWVRLHSNTTGTDYYSTALTDPLTGNWLATVPEDDYSQYYGVTQSVPGTPTLSDAHFRVAYTKGADATLNSLTITTGPLVIGTDPGGGQLLRVGGTGHFSGAVTLDAFLYANGTIQQSYAGGGNAYWDAAGGGGTHSFRANAGVTVLATLSAANGLTVSAGGLTVNDGVDTFTITTSNPGSSVRALAPNLSSAGNVSIGVGKAISSGNSAFLVWQNDPTTPFASLETYGGANPLRVSASNWNVTTAGAATFNAGLTVSAGNISWGNSPGNGTALFPRGPAVTDWFLFAFDSASASLNTALGVAGQNIFRIGVWNGSGVGITPKWTVDMTGAVVQSGGLTFDTTGSTTASPRTVLFNSGGSTALRMAFDNTGPTSGSGIQTGNNQRVQFWSYWGLEIRGQANSGPPSFVAGGVNDNSLTVYGPASGTGLGLEVVSGGLKVTAGKTVLVGPVNLGVNAVATADGDVAISRASASNTGALFFGNTLSHSILWDGTQFIITDTMALTGQFKHSGTTFGLYGKTPVVQPAAPVTLAEVIAIIRGCGLSA